MEKKEIKKNLEKLWKNIKKELEVMNKELDGFLKKGESALKDVSQKSKEKLEIVNALVKREKLYYLLGKGVSSLPTSRWSTSKKIKDLIKEIKTLNRKIKQG